MIRSNLTCTVCAPTLLLMMLLTAIAGAACARTIEIPSVSGRVVTTSGEGIEYALVAVTFIGTHGDVDDPCCDLFKIDVVSDLTDDRGTFRLPAPLVEIDGRKTKFLGAKIDITCEGFRKKTIDIANISAHKGGFISSFILGLFGRDDEEETAGGIAAAVARGYKAVKEARFPSAYDKLLSSAPIRLDRTRASIRALVRRQSNFTSLYNEP